jgi:hypothetical protein
VPKTLGDVLPFGTEVRDAAGLLANAGTMTLTVTRPDGTAEPGSPFTVTPTSTGIYDKDVASAQVGLYVGYWLATGANAGADEPQVFYVRSSAAATFVSLEDAKAHCNIPLDETRHDEELKWMLGAATDAVEMFCGPVRRRTYTDDVQGGHSSLILHRNSVVSITSVTPILTNAASVTVADLDVSPTGSPIVRHKLGQSISSGHVRVVYTAGRLDIPDALYGAALIIVAHLWETQRGPGGPNVLGSTSVQGGETMFVPVLGFAIPNRAMDLMKLHPAPAGIA